MTDHDDATTKPSATSFEQSLSSEIAREFLKEQKLPCNLGRERLFKGSG